MSLIYFWEFPMESLKKLISDIKIRKRARIKSSLNIKIFFKNKKKSFLIEIFQYIDR